MENCNHPQAGALVKEQPPKCKVIDISSKEYLLEQAFPTLDPGIVPFGSRVLVQIRNPRMKSAGGIYFHKDTQETEKWNTQIAKVIACGPLAFHSRDTQEPWPEGSWCGPGDFVRVSKYGGDRWDVDLGDTGTALFVIYNDLDLIGKVTIDPLAIKAFI